MAYKKIRKKSRKKYKIMKGGSLAGRFFRFLAGESERDRIRLNELKELDEYKRQKKIREKIEREEERTREIEDNYKQDQEETEKYLQNNKIIDRSEEENNDILQRGGSKQTLQEIHDNDKKSFLDWYNGSTANYAEVVKRRDPNFEETATNEPGGFSWKRHQNDLVGDFSYHLKDYSRQTGGTKKRKKKKRRRKRKTKKMLCFRGTIKNLKKFGKKNAKKSKKRKIKFTKGSRKRYNKWRKRK